MSSENPSENLIEQGNGECEISIHPADERELRIDISLPEIHLTLHVKPRQAELLRGFIKVSNSRSQIELCPPKMSCRLIARYSVFTDSPDEVDL